MVGYLMRRLGQLGVSPRKAIAISTGVRTAYHLYYGLDALPLVAIGVLFAWRWQANESPGRLGRLVVAHTVYDGLLSTSMILGI